MLNFLPAQTNEFLSSPNWFPRTVLFLSIAWHVSPLINGTSISLKIFCLLPPTKKSWPQPREIILIKFWFFWIFLSNLQPSIEIHSTWHLKKSQFQTAEKNSNNYLLGMHMLVIVGYFPSGTGLSNVNTAMLFLKFFKINWGWTTNDAFNSSLGRGSVFLDMSCSPIRTISGDVLPWKLKLQFYWKISLLTDWQACVLLSRHVAVRLKLPCLRRRKSNHKS